jgi:sterol desaturase/sphingolipid hydroxylase (fatty acid hydroxylase superfamily)
MLEIITSYLLGKGGIIAASLVVLFVLERLFPVAQWIGGVARVIKNLGLAAFNFAASPLIVIPITVFAASHAPGWRPEILTGWTGLVFDLLMLDLWIYWWHRANHAVPFLWRFHEVHHLDEMLDTTSALRFHFGEVILSSLVRAVVIFVLAVPLFSVLVFETIVVLAALFQHSNLRLPATLERALSLVIVTPSIHWLHHHALRRDTDSSYSLGLSIWDQLFRSRSSTLRTPDMKMGVEGRVDRPFLGLVARPLDPP